MRACWSGKQCNHKTDCREEKLTCKQASNSYETLSPIIMPSITGFDKCSLKQCDPGYFLCSKLRFCIKIENICDGINHCIYNEDELNCSNLLNLFFHS